MKAWTSHPKARALLLSHRAALSAMIAANRACKADRVGRAILDAKSAEARRWIARIDAELERGNGAGNEGLFGENGYAPALRDIIDQSKRQRELAVEEREEAA